MEKVFEIYIKTTPERLWQALTDGEMRGAYTFAVNMESDWTLGSAYRGCIRIPGRDHRRRESRGRGAPPAGPEPPRAWSDDVESEGTSRVTYEIEPVADSCRLTVTHDQLRTGANPEIYGGWPMILSGLKTLLETGGTLTTPGSLLYAPQTAPAS